MKKAAATSLLVTVSTASLLVTLFLSNTTANYDIHNNDALSFEAPHLQGEGTAPRRNLSEVVGAGNSTKNKNVPLRQPCNSTAQQLQEAQQRQDAQYQQLQQQQQQTDATKNKDNRPSGVAYEYIPPPPINVTARCLLSAEFPNLAQLDAAPTSTALCGIVKDAEAYLDEWADYHFGLGFHTIYLIDNSKDHELQTWQNKRRSSGHSVRVMPKPGSHRQMYGYHMCAAEHKNDHAHMAFFDVDEFLVLKKHETVDEMLGEHLKKGALAISWYVFGTGGRSMYAPLPVTKRFLYRDGLKRDERHSHWGNVKSIVKLSDYGSYPQSPHSMKTNRMTAGSDKAWTDTSGNTNSFDAIGAVNRNRPVDVAVIHHYRYLSPKEFRWKSCVRKTVDDKFKDCEQLKRSAPYEGIIRDDSAWQMLKTNVPKYAMFDAFEDYL
eukprot:CAMPEP_0201657598 /NCGR_PEP_ID=MMETSP0494-20130426/788_1 /ASSEMBLY_ACC=CAM_ASM_000839 /TAXON_ID=420259 /ORGANISM="Thalassiosira gravida, Strain GMp14c1" /LENGTH=434 /DNA_ID=CAMNT_0048134467 /DNA_START=60 /DNA_END=1364 /DNA_ORIENTATION=-